VKGDLVQLRGMPRTSWDRPAGTVGPVDQVSPAGLGEPGGPRAAGEAEEAEDAGDRGDTGPVATAQRTGETAAGQAVTALYQSHALGLTRLAFVMLGDRPAAEDVVQDAFCALYRAWDRLAEHDHALGYLRVSVINGCRTAIRRNRRVLRPQIVRPAESAEANALLGEEQRAAVAALRRLPPRQREAIVLRYYADLPESEIADVMGISRGTVKSTTARALAALGRILREEQ
jgi:RNA polymerase sigma-70 factor (sigma-E family)